MDNRPLGSRTEERFLSELRHHLAGWLTKVTTDLSAESFEHEIEKLGQDPVYRAFGLASPEYALIRLMGRLSISIGRRLGEIYDKIPRFITQSRFSLSHEDVAPKIGGRLELDVCVPLERLSFEDKEHVIQVASSHLSGYETSSGLAIEIRYNFNPNDSARLRKDVQMAELLLERSLFPIYLIFSTISPRDEAIARLSRAGWIFLVGDAASNFMRDLIGMNFAEILETEAVSTEIQHEMGRIMRALYESEAVVETVRRYSRPSS